MKNQIQDFQIFAKPVGAVCNLACHYCYYSGKGDVFSSPLMTDAMLELYIQQHIDTCLADTVQFSWHGGEPTTAGIEYFQKIVGIQNASNVSGKTILNGMQTNGTLLNDEWAAFLAENRFTVGISIDGPEDIHNIYRRTKGDKGTHERVVRGWNYLCRYGIPADILCVVNDVNVMYPLQVYRYLKSIGAKYISFLPLVERAEDLPGMVTARSVHPEAFGAFLCTIFDEWVAGDIGKVQVQIFEEATRTAFGQDHSLCLFRPTCGDIPVIEHDGSVYSCDHFVTPEYRVGNIVEHPLSTLLRNVHLQTFGTMKRDGLPQQCHECEVLVMCNGECPKNRFIEMAGGGTLNYLCPGYKLFFTHCQPFIKAVSAEWEAQGKRSTTQKTGRNQPCPCGSGLKFKKCCQKE